MNEAKVYINTYFKLLQGFYNMSKLCLNDDKTNIMVVNNPRLDEVAKNIELETKPKPVKPKESFHILGWKIHRNLSIFPNVQTTSSIVFQRINRVRQLSK